MRDDTPVVSAKTDSIPRDISGDRSLAPRTAIRLPAGDVRNPAVPCRRRRWCRLPRTPEPSPRLRLAIAGLVFGFWTMPLIVSVASFCSYASVRSSSVGLTAATCAGLADTSAAPPRVNELIVKPTITASDRNRCHDAKPPRPGIFPFGLGEQPAHARDGGLQIQLDPLSLAGGDVSLRRLRFVGEFVRDPRCRHRRSLDLLWPTASPR